MCWSLGSSLRHCCRGRQAGPAVGSIELHRQPVPLLPAGQTNNLCDENGFCRAAHLQRADRLPTYLLSFWQRLHPRIRACTAGLPLHAPPAHALRHARLAHRLPLPHSSVSPRLGCAAAGLVASSCLCLPCCLQLLVFPNGTGMLGPAASCAAGLLSANGAATGAAAFSKSAIPLPVTAGSHADGFPVPHLDPSHHSENAA